MNNSKLAIDSVSFEEEPKVDRTPQLREQEASLIRIIEAIQKVKVSAEWSTLKTEVFNDIPEVLAREMKEESRKEKPDTSKLNRLAGQLKWAEQFADMDKLEAFFRTQLTNIRKYLNGKPE